MKELLIVAYISVLHSYFFPPQVYLFALSLSLNATFLPSWFRFRTLGISPAFPFSGPHFSIQSVCKSAISFPPPLPNFILECCEARRTGDSCSKTPMDFRGEIHLHDGFRGEVFIGKIWGEGSRVRDFVLNGRW